MSSVVVDFDIFFEDGKPFDDFFSSLSKQQAEEYLAAFVAQRDEYVGKLWAYALHEGIVECRGPVYEVRYIDLFQDRLLQAVDAHAKEMRSRSLSPCLSQELKAWIIGFGFFIAECIMSRHSDFRWKVGWRPVKGYIDQNIPVVSNQMGKHDGNDWNPVGGLATYYQLATKRPPRCDSLAQKVDEFVAGARRMK